MLLAYLRDEQQGRKYLPKTLLHWWPLNYNPIPQANLSLVHQHTIEGRFFSLLSFARIQAEKIIYIKASYINVYEDNYTPLKDNIYPKSKNIDITHDHMKHIRALNLHSHTNAIECTSTIDLYV